MEIERPLQEGWKVLRYGDKGMTNSGQITKSQLCHAHNILEDKQRIMTQYRYLFTDEEREANGIAILAIEKQMEHLKAKETEE